MRCFLLLLLVAFCPDGSALRAAPAPLPKRGRAPKPATIPGRCTLNWFGVRYVTVFRPDGGYESWQPGMEAECRWVGRWELKGRTLVILERPVTPGSVGQEWKREFVLDARLREQVGKEGDGWCRFSIEEAEGEASKR